MKARLQRCRQKGSQNSLKGVGANLINEGASYLGCHARNRWVLKRCWTSWRRRWLASPCLTIRQGSLTSLHFPCRLQMSGDTSTTLPRQPQCSLDHFCLLESPCLYNDSRVCLTFQSCTTRKTDATCPNLPRLRTPPMNAACPSLPENLKATLQTATCTTKERCRHPPSGPMVARAGQPSLKQRSCESFFPIIPQAVCQEQAKRSENPKTPLDPVLWQPSTQHIFLRSAFLACISHRMLSDVRRRLHCTLPRRGLHGRRVRSVWCVTTSSGVICLSEMRSASRLHTKTT